MNPNQRGLMQVDISVEANKIFEYLRNNRVAITHVPANEGTIAFELSVPVEGKKQKVFYALSFNNAKRSFELLEFWPNALPISISAANMAAYCNATFRWAVTHG